MEVEDILDSDQKILNHSKRSVENGTQVFFFDWGDGSPPFKGILPEELNSAILVEWCTAVRNAYHARKDRKEAEANRAAAVVRSASGRDDPGPGYAGNSREPVPPIDTDPKKTLEEAVAQSLAQFRRRRESALQRASALSAELSEVDAYIQQLNGSINYLSSVQEKL